MDSKASDSVLVVSNNNILQDSLQDYLIQAGFSVSLASDSESTLKAIQVQRPCVAIVDLQEPPGLAEEIIRDFATRDPSLPIISLSNEMDIHKIESSLHLGAIDYLIKPVSNPVLLKLSVKNAIEKDRLMSENLQYRQQLESTNLELKQSINKLRDDQEAGRFVQQKLFPKSPVTYFGYKLDYTVKPSSYLSGDFIDYFKLDDHRFVFYLADVSGHGSASAFITLFLKVSMSEHLRNFKKHGNDLVTRPSEVLNWFNQQLIHLDLGNHLTMFYGVLDSRAQSLKYSIAAQFPLPILVNNGKAEVLETTSLPVGVFADSEYEEIEKTLSDKFALVMFSDGIIEVLPQDSLAEKEQYLFELVEKGGADIESLSKKLEIDSIASAPDDIGLLVLEKNL